MNENSPRKHPSLFVVISVVINTVLLALIIILFFSIAKINLAMSEMQKYIQANFVSRAYLEENYVDRQQYEKLKVNIPNAIGITPTEDNTPDNTPLMAYEPVTFSGIIRKERIPEEYALGDFWYIMYFDVPEMIETAGGRMRRTNLQIQASSIESLEPYLDKEVTVNGRLSYGYAESRVILADEVVLK